MQSGDVLINISQLILQEKKTLDFQCLPISVVLIFPLWLVTSYQCDVPEPRAGKGCAKSAFASQHKVTPLV